jgi:hypothetical protein
MIVGRLLVGYGELEFDLMNCLSAAAGDRMTAVRLIYRVRSEGARLDIADSLLRPYFDKLKLSKVYEEGYNSLFHCKSIRNKYAHSHWTSTQSGLFYTDFEKPAQTTVGDGMVTVHHVDLALLKQQEKYFEYCQKILLHLYDQTLLQSGKVPLGTDPMPKKLQKPPPCTPEEKAPPYR